MPDFIFASVRSGCRRAAVSCFLLMGLAVHVPGVLGADFGALATPVEGMKVKEGFEVELLHTVPKEDQGSWVAICTDPKGRLIVSDQYGPLYRITVPDGEGEEVEVEKLEVDIGQAQGLLYAFDSLYVMVANDAYQGRGLYRLRDTNGDDQFDEVKLLRKLSGGGEHGPHAIVLSPDGQSLHIVVGNQTALTELDSSLVPPHWSEDLLLPRLWDGNGFMKGVLAPGGWIARVDPEGEHWELVANGFRNQYDAAFNRDGELFTFDADMEWDLNTPWYRPTRVCQVVSGAEFGWRSGAGKWPSYYPDSVGPVVNIGPGSPTGVVFGYGAKFPAQYQDAFFICDWSFGKLYAVHLQPDGAGYTAGFEEFITGQPLPLTDLVVRPQDGALYFTIGGRRTQSALYRVRYTGGESTELSRGSAEGAIARGLRRSLEAWHGKRVPGVVEEVWPFLGHSDRSIRYAARVALEWQDPSDWAKKALQEEDPRKAITALIGLARSSARDEFHRAQDAPAPDQELQEAMFDRLGRIEMKSLDLQGKLELMRAHELAITRLGRPSPSRREKLIRQFQPLFPSSSAALDTELAQMLVFLEAPSAARKLMGALRNAPTQEEQIEYARILRVLKSGWTPELREEYFSWFNRAANFKGGASLAGFLRDMKNDALATLSEEEKARLEPVLTAAVEQKSPLEALAGRSFVREWDMEELVPLVEEGLTEGGLNFERGRQLFGGAACAACHRFKDEGAAVGPDLTSVSGRFNVRDLLESIVEPDKEISDQYGSIIIRKKDGESVIGRVANLNGDVLMIMENMFAPGDFTQVRRQDIESIRQSEISMMPEGLLNTLTAEEVQDLMGFLMSGGDREAPYFK